MADFVTLHRIKISGRPSRQGTQDRMHMADLVTQDVDGRPC